MKDILRTCMRFAKTAQLIQKSSRFLLTPDLLLRRLLSTLVTKTRHRGTMYGAARGGPMLRCWKACSLA
eukprot:1146101-Pelagomonas_calceolata.AAC.3